MDEFFKKLKNNERILRNFEIDVKPYDADDDNMNPASPPIPPPPPPPPQEGQSDNLKIVDNIAISPDNDQIKDDVIRKPTHTGEVDEYVLFKEEFSYLSDPSKDEVDTKPKLDSEAEYVPSELEKMLEEAGETLDFLS